MQIQLNLITDTYSIIGTKKLNCTDDAKKLFRFTDTGGLFGDPINHTLSFKDYCKGDNFLAITSGGGKVPCAAYGKAVFPDGTAVFSCENDIAALLESFLKLATPNGFLKVAASNSLPKIYFPATITPTEAAKFHEAFAVTNENNLLRDLELDSIFNDDLISNNVLPISIKKNGDYIQIEVLLHSYIELPLEKIPVKIVGNSLIFKTKFLVGNNQINGFSLKFPTMDLASKYAAMLALVNIDDAAIVTTSDTSQSGLISHVAINGMLDGQQVEKPRCEAELHEKELILFLMGSTQLLAKFDLCSTDLAIEGTSSSFIISNSKDTILKISAQSEGFHQAIFANRNVCSAAHRSSNSGPYVSSTTSGRLVRLEPRSNIFHLGNGEVLVVDAVSENLVPTLVLDKQQSVLKIQNISIVGQLPMLEGISARLTSTSVENVVRDDFKNSVPLLLGLEGQYFTYSIFGQIAELQLSLSVALGSESSAEISSLSSEQGKQTFLAYMMQNAASLGRNLETTIHYLPAFVVSKDLEFLTGVGLDKHLNIKNIEQAYQHALSCITSLAPHLYRIDGSVSRLSSLRKTLANDDGWGKFLPLGVSAAASFVNPFMLIGAAQQGISLLGRNDSQAAMEKDTELDAFSTCSSEWDYAIHTLLPALSYRVAQEIYPMRLHIAGLLLSGYEKADVAGKERLVLSVSDRLARLKTFTEFPSINDAGSHRGKCIEFILNSQRHAEASQFRYF